MFEKLLNDFMLTTQVLNGLEDTSKQRYMFYQGKVRVLKKDFLNIEVIANAYDLKLEIEVEKRDIDFNVNSAFRKINDAKKLGKFDYMINNLNYAEEDRRNNHVFKFRFTNFDDFTDFYLNYIE